MTAGIVVKENLEICTYSMGSRSTLDDRFESVYKLFPILEERFAPALEKSHESEFVEAGLAKLTEAGNILGIKVLDHIIISKSF
jgi:hypothetical protein